MSALRFFVGVLVSQLLFQGSTQLGFRQRYFKFEQVEACPNSSTNVGKVAKLILKQPDKFHIYVDAELSFSRDIIAPIKFHILSNRCSLVSDSICIHNDYLKFSVCEHLNDENALWTPFVKSIDPKFRCPIKMGTYKIKNGTVDFSVIARLPLEGFRYSLSFKFYEMIKPKPLEILCLDLKFAVTFAVNNPSRKRTKTSST